MTAPPSEPAANDPRRHQPPKVQTLADPPDPPALKVVNLVGYGVVRDDDGQPRQLQQAGRPRSDRPSARYVVICDDFADACYEAEEQLIAALARHTYPEDARHVVPIIIRNLRMRDFRAMAMRRDAVAVATDHLASGTGDEPWWQLAYESEGGLLLPWSVRPEARAASFLLVADRFMDHLEIDEPSGRISLDDLPTRRQGGAL